MKMGNSLIRVVQIPIIEEQLHDLKTMWEQRAYDAETMVCTADNLQSIKNFRAEMRKEFDSVEVLRKQAKQAIMKPYNHFESVYKECITTAFRKADSALAEKISEVEADIKRHCEEGLRDYFDELCAAHHLDWLTYEQTGIDVDMASAKVKTPKKLREQLADFVVSVAESVDRINLLDDAAEIMAEYKKQANLDAAKAICDVKERHRREEAEKASYEARRAEREREAEMVRRVEALATPAVVEAPEPVFKCTFTVRATKSQLRKLKEFLNMEGIKYE